MAGTSYQISNFMFGIKKPYKSDCSHTSGNAAWWWKRHQSKLHQSINAVFVAFMWLPVPVSWCCIAAHWVTDMEEEPVDRSQHLSDAVKTLAFVFSCSSIVSNYFRLMSFSLLGLQLYKPCSGNGNWYNLYLFYIILV